MCGSMVDIQSATAEIMRGKERQKEEDRKKKPQGKKYNGPPITQGGHKKLQDENIMVCPITQATITTMWANAQRDGRPAEYRWCPLFNTAKFG